MKRLHCICLALILCFLLPSLAACTGLSSGGTTNAGGTASPDATGGTTPPEATTVTVEPAPAGQVTLLSDADGAEYGSVLRSNDEVFITAGERLVLTAQATKDGRFICWTRSAPLASGGILLSQEKVLTLTAEEGGNAIYYANFLPRDAVYLLYHLGDGKVAANGRKQYVARFSHEFFLCPNTVPDTGVFVRDGYTLLEYNTAADGKSGTAVNPGGKLAPESDGLIELWAVWARWSPAADFRFEPDGEGGVTLTGYTGNDDPLVIPETLGGLPVRTIAAGAVKSKSFTTLVIPKSVKTVAAGAFASCRKFDRLYLTDAILSIPDDAFSDCRAFRTLCYNAATAPVFGTNFFGACSIKYERLLTLPDDGRATLVTLGGSSMVYGLRSEYLERLLDGQYRVINYGTNQGTCGLFYAEVASHYLGEGDLFVIAPEYGGVQCGLAFSWKTVREFEYCYNILRDADMSHYTKVLSSITECNSVYRAKLSAGTYDDYTGQLNQAGDGIDNLMQKVKIPTTPSVDISAASLSAERVRAFNLATSLLRDAGADVLFSFPPILAVTIRDTGNPDAYAEAIRASLSATLISSPSTYYFAYEDMYDSNYHLLATSAEVRTRRLAADILAWLKSR